jgi:hypothetical protein
VKTGGAEIIKKYLEKRMPEEEEDKSEGLIAYSSLGAETWDIYIREAAASH